MLTSLLSQQVFQNGKMHLFFPMCSLSKHKDDPGTYGVNCGDVHENHSNSNVSQMELKRSCFVKIIKTLQVLARQILALCGYSSDEN